MYSQKQNLCLYEFSYIKFIFYFFISDGRGIKITLNKIAYMYININIFSEDTISVILHSIIVIMIITVIKSFT